jgi:hypothetical protein
MKNGKQGIVEDWKEMTVQTEHHRMWFGRRSGMLKYQEKFRSLTGVRYTALFLVIAYLLTDT